MSEDGDSGNQHERTGETEPENNRDSDGGRLLIRGGTTSGTMRGKTGNSIKLTPDSPPQVFEGIIRWLKNNPEYKDWAPTGEALLIEYFKSDKKKANEDVQTALDELNSIAQKNMRGGTGTHHNQGNYVRDINSDAEMNDDVDDHDSAKMEPDDDDADADMYSIDIYAKKKKKIGYAGIRSMLREINMEMVSMEKEKKALVSFYEKKVADLEDTIFELRKDRASAEDGNQFWA